MSTSNDVEKQLRLDEDIDPWEQQPDESNEYYLEFQRYKKLARRVNSRTKEPMPRSLTALAENSKWGLRHLRRVAHDYRWAERAAAADIEAENHLAGKIADARISMLHQRLGMLEKMSDISVAVLEATPPEDWKIRDVIELIKVQLIAQDNLLGLALQRNGSYAEGSVGVDIRLPMGASTAAIESRIEDVIAELKTRPSAVIDEEDNED
jgi:hypothetical protein